MENLAKLLKDRKLTISTAESCTGGLLASTLTNEPGSSSFFKGGIIAYSASVKQELLKIPKNIEIVSNECAVAMNYGLMQLMNTSICISVTGYIGPFLNDYTDQGLVYYSILCDDIDATYKIISRDTNREEGKKEIVDMIINSLIEILG
jgi:nicotinamide-nucleotide amidase